MLSRLISILLALGFALATLPAHAEQGYWNNHIFRTSDGKRLWLENLAIDLNDADFIVLGEHHSNQLVQRAQARVIQNIVSRRGIENDFTVGWEFLNKKDHLEIGELWNEMRLGRLNAAGLLDSYFKLPADQMGYYYTYSPILEITQRFHGELLGVNLTRAEKSPVTKGGIKAADPAIIPDGFAMGPATYKERFVEAMKEHIPANKLDNYFAAQCLTDDVMADTLTRAPHKKVKFLINGSFHSDYNEGAAARLQIRNAQHRVATIKFVDASEFSANDLQLMLLQDVKFGFLADYLYFVNEPISSTQVPRLLPETGVLDALQGQLSSEEK